VRRLLLVPALALVLAACGGGATQETAARTTEGGGRETVTIAHAFGETEITGTPERVVSVGFNDHDTLLALGVTPVGVRDWYGEQPSATWPWAQDELGDAEPAVLPSTAIEPEAVAALDPDLIVGIFSGMTQQEYDLLSRIAPTVARPADDRDYGTPWRDVTRTYGEALGRSDRAEEVIAEVDAQIAAARAANPAFAGAEGAVVFLAEGHLGAYASADLRSRLLTDLGFMIPPAIDDAAAGGFFAPVSLEQAELVDNDVLVWITATEAEIGAIRDLPVRAALDAGREGREVFLPFELNGAMSFSSPLSIPYLLDGLVPELAAAADGDPATPVPSAAP
jgi:iron complex transport system substrate-binding protein